MNNFYPKEHYDDLIERYIDGIVMNYTLLNTVWLPYPNIGIDKQRWNRNLAIYAKSLRKECLNKQLAGY